MWDLTRFSISDVLGCTNALGELGEGARSMEMVAQRTVEYLYETFRDPETGGHACTLVRFYKTHDFGGLDIMRRGFARSAAGGNTLQPATKCLTLMGTVGDRPEWNSCKRSIHHQAIPLVSESMVSQSPMIAQLIHQLGLEVRDVVGPSPDLLLHTNKRSYDVFYVPEALGSPYIPAQDDFVVPYGVRSVVGCGRMLPSLDLFAVILFSRVLIPKDAASRFSSLGLALRGALLPYMDGRIFEP